MSCPACGGNWKTMGILVAVVIAVTAIAILSQRAVTTKHHVKNDSEAPSHQPEHKH